MKGYFSVLNGDRKAVAYYFKSLGPGWYAVIDQYFYDEYDRDVTIFYFIACIGRPIQPPFGILDPKAQIGVREFPGRNLVYVLKPEQISVLPELRKKYPGGSYREFYSPFDRTSLLFFSYEVRRP